MNPPNPTRPGGDARALRLVPTRLRGPIGTVLLSVLAWSVALQLVALGSTAFVDPRPHPGTSVITLAWQVFDGGWFKQIVAGGYGEATKQAPTDLRLAFYPGYPLLARGVYEVLNPVGLGITGAMLVTNQLLVFALAVLLYLLASALGASAEIGVRSVQYLLVFPFAYFLLAPYSECLFLTCIAGFAWGLTTRRYWVAAAFGAAASAVRAEGVVLPLILAIGFLEQHRWSWRSLTPRMLVCICTPISGALAYALYQWAKFGNPNYAAHAEAAGWERSVTLNLWRVISQSFGQPLLSAGRLAGLPVEVFITFPLMAAFGFLTWKVWRRFGAALGAMCALFILVPLFSGTTISFNRYMLALLPCFVVLASWSRHDAFDFAYRTIGVALMALFLVMFTHAIWTG